MADEKIPESQVQPEKTLAEELHVDGTKQGKNYIYGRLLSAASKHMPVVEFSPEALVLHPPQKPFDDQEAQERLVVQVDERGILLDDLGAPRKIAGARYNGHEVWWLGEQKPGTLKYYVGWLDDQGAIHKLLIQDEPITVDIAYKLRNRTHDGELAIFPDLKSQ